MESIIKNGLKPSGTKLNDGTYIKPLEGHIYLDKEVKGIKNWAQAVFVSPNIFYAADSCYAERIISGNQQWAVLVEAMVRPGIYTDSTSTLLEWNERIGEPKQVEYRV